MFNPALSFSRGKIRGFAMHLKSKLLSEDAILSKINITEIYLIEIDLNSPYYAFNVVIFCISEHLK
jgi:hypothetical protein